MMTKNVSTYCRICEAACPLTATVNNNGEVTSLAPNTNHPLKGVACHKGLSYLDIHQDPDRLNYPIKRKNPRSEIAGDFERISWDTAISECSSKLKNIIEKYGPNSVAVFSGNPGVFNARLLTYTGAFSKMIGSSMVFSAATQDMSNRVAATIALYGTEAIMIPDLENTDYLLCMGANPRVSKWAVFNTTNDSGKTLENIKKRGGKITFVNPRKTESSTPETGETLLIKPSTDVYFLCAVLHEIHQQNGLDQTAITTYGKGVDEVLDFVSQYPAKRVSTITGISTEEIKTVATDIIAANGASLYVSVGVNQGGQGLLCAWLADVITFVTGNLGRKGGMFKPTSYLDMYAPTSLCHNKVETSLGELYFTNSGSLPLPSVALPKLIASGEIKALVNITGNPLLSAAGESEWREAIENLDLLISLDFNRNTTAEASDYVLPGTDFLERADFNLVARGVQTIPYIQYTEAVTAPKGERRHDWQILIDLLKGMGVFKGDDSTGWGIANQILSMSDLSIEKLQNLPDQIKFFEPTPYNDLYKKVIKHKDGKIQCYPALFEEHGLFERCHTMFNALSNEPENTLKLVSMRTTYMHNTWMANVQKFRRGAHSDNPLHMCSEDGKRLNLVNGQAIRVFNQYGNIKTQVKFDDNLRQGTVAMAHGYGKGRSNLRVAEHHPGANPNELTPTEMCNIEPLSNMSWIGAYPVEVESLA